MSRLKKIRCILLFFGVICFLFPVRIHAYIDPGTGSYILQLLLAAFIGVSVGIRIFWKKIKTFCSGLFHKKTDHEG